MTSALLRVYNPEHAIIHIHPSRHGLSHLKTPTVTAAQAKQIPAKLRERVYDTRLHDKKVLATYNHRRVLQLLQYHK